MLFKRIIVVITVAFVAACSSSLPRKSPDFNAIADEDVVSMRASERWGHIVAKDYKSAYNYFSPGTKIVMPLESWELRMAHSQIVFIGVDVVGVECRDDVMCKATMLLRYKVRALGVGEVETSQQRTEDWVKSDGQWFYVAPDVI